MQKSFKNGVWSQAIKGCVVALFVSIVAILIMSLLARFFTFGVDVIPIINQVIKVVSVAVGVAVATREEKFLFKGILTGIFYWLGSFALFLAMGGKLDLRHFFLDLAIAVVVASIVAFFLSKRR
ncbi:MAG: TIGR04086 family membrane protein [Clostridia bacterium]|nr:TIGR04086 family membrane protein [Clostridia bacterium]